MKTPVNRERLAATFTELCEISSPSRKEADVSAFLQKKFTQLGADSIYEDSSAAGTGANCGNLIIRFPGSHPELERLFFSCHMDTVEPATGIEVTRTGDIFTSKGETVLGGDDKSGIAAILELLTLLKENNIPHCAIEVVLTTCEEIGLLGAKHLEFEKIQSPYGYALDSTGIDHVIIGAPAANKFKISIKGVAAHAGLNPETGINALSLTAEALSRISVGRIDEESTRNFGLIQGGAATNIVPDLVTIHGEARSHSSKKLDNYTQEIIDTFNRVIDDWREEFPEKELQPLMEYTVTADYPLLSLSQDTPVVQRVRMASEKSGRKLEYIVAGGGSDANIFNSHGLPTAIVATGMDKVHTVNEQLDLNNLIGLTELLYALTT
ncbi:MAG: M20/M25/M40 family metallo-hydrolase [Deltaproteobacteria bacterium]|nr:M20/M25/M40 family metallo-hydrolase [Deltaproteobacteria bacterium]